MQGGSQMKFPGRHRWLGVVSGGLCLASGPFLAAQEDGSLNNLNFERPGPATAPASSVEENRLLREKLAASEAAVAALQKNLADANAEAEIFRRKATELNVRLEALGNEALDERLVKLLRNLTYSEGVGGTLREALLALSEAVLRFQKAAATTDAEARLDLEAAMRKASMALGSTPPGVAEGRPAAAGLTEARVISIKEDLSLIVANVGSTHGVKVGMPFRVMRGEKAVGLVRVVDVRENIAGALIQSLSDKEQIKSGDRLVVDAQ